MRTAVRLAGYAAALALAFGAAWSVGCGRRRSRPGRRPTPVARTGPPRPPVPEPPRPGARRRAGEPAPLGLRRHRGRLHPGPAEPHVHPGPARRAGLHRHRPRRPAGARVRRRSEAAMHVVVVRRDAAGFQHLRPRSARTGCGGSPLVLPAAGVYRLYADFAPTGGAGAGAGHRPVRARATSRRSRSSPSRVAQIDGYQVRLDGDLVAGRPSQVFATISRDGAAVTDLQPYLGAFGHLVALRRSDLAYLRAAAGRRPTRADRPVRAGHRVHRAACPPPGSYRLFLDFRHGRGVPRRRVHRRHQGRGVITDAPTRADRAASAGARARPIGCWCRRCSHSAGGRAVGGAGVAVPALAVDRADAGRAGRRLGRLAVPPGRAPATAAAAGRPPTPWSRWARWPRSAGRCTRCSPAPRARPA